MLGSNVQLRIEGPCVGNGACVVVVVADPSKFNVNIAACKLIVVFIIVNMITSSCSSSSSSSSSSSKNIITKDQVAFIMYINNINYRAFFTSM